MSESQLLQMRAKQRWMSARTCAAGERAVMAPFTLAAYPCALRRSATASPRNDFSDNESHADMKNTSNLTRPLVPAMIALAMLAACGKHEPPSAVPAATTDPAAEAPAKRAFVSTVPHTSTVDVAVGGIDTQIALALSDGGSAAGQVASTAAGKVVGVSVYVGNYFDSATGAFDVEACVADRCQKGTVEASTSIDNEMLEIPLAAPLDVVAGDLVTYTFSRATGTNPIAIWTYGAISPTDHFIAPSDVARTPRVSLLLN